MSHLQVSFNQKTIQNNELNISLKGHLNTMNAINFKNDLLNISKSKSSDCTIDIQNLESIDLTGLNALAMAHRDFEDSGRILTIVSTKENAIDKFLHLTKFNRYLNLKRA